MKTAFKKLKALYVYEILLHAHKPLTLTQIHTKLKVEYGVNETDKTLRDLLYTMMDAEVVKGTERERIDHLKGQEGHDEEKAIFYVGYALKEKPINDKELSWLIDSVRFSKQLSEEKAEQMISRLLALGSGELRQKVQSESKSRRGFHIAGDRFFDNLDVLKDAIKDQKSIRFMLLNYAGTKPQLLPVQEEPLFVKPVATVMVNGFHYLIAFDPQSDCLQHYRIDRMKEIEIAEDNIDYDVLNNRPAVDDYLWTHSLMRTGKKETIKVRLPDDKLDLVIDRFGAACRFFDYGDEDDMIVTLQSNAEDLFVWALENGEFVEVLEPQHIRNRIATTVQAMTRRYLKSDEDKYFDAIRSAKKTGAFYCEDYNFSKRTEWLRLFNISQLELNNNGFTDICFLCQFKELEMLDLVNEHITDISVIKDFKLLESLRLENTDVTDLSPLRGSSIRFLALKGNKNIIDYSPIYEMKNLRLLDIDEDVAKHLDTEKLISQCGPLEIVIKQSDGEEIHILSPALLEDRC